MKIWNKIRNRLSVNRPGRTLVIVELLSMKPKTSREAFRKVFGLTLYFIAATAFVLVTLPYVLPYVLPAS